MKKQTIDDTQMQIPANSLSETEACENSRQLALFQTAMRLLTGKWKGEILYSLVDGTRRFGELRRAIPGITQHMLTTQLRDLEAHALVRRTVFPEVPPRVEYEMTAAARDLRPIFEAIWHWSQAHPEVLDVRQQAASAKGRSPKAAQRAPMPGGTIPPRSARRA
jgi:DNA-binding HxlR family transcriptional regulator